MYHFSSFATTHRPSLRSGLFVLSHSKRKNHCIIERDIIQRYPLNEVPAETAWDVQAGSSVFLPFYITNIEYHTHHYTSLDLVITRPYASFRSHIYRSHSFIPRSATLAPARDTLHSVFNHSC